MNDTTLKRQIECALQAFRQDGLERNALDFLNVLGYRSDKRLELSPNTFDSFAAEFARDTELNPKQALPEEWRSVDFLFQLTDDEIRAAGGQLSLFESSRTWNSTAMQSYLFFAIELKQPYSLRRTGACGPDRRSFPGPRPGSTRRGDRPCPVSAEARLPRISRAG